MSADNVIRAIELIANAEATLAGGTNPMNVQWDLAAALRLLEEVEAA